MVYDKMEHSQEGVISVTMEVGPLAAPQHCSTVTTGLEGTALASAGCRLPCSTNDARVPLQCLQCLLLRTHAMTVISWSVAAPSVLSRLHSAPCVLCLQETADQQLKQMLLAYMMLLMQRRPCQPQSWTSCVRTSCTPSLTSRLTLMLKQRCQG